MFGLVCEAWRGLPCWRSTRCIRLLCIRRADGVLLLQVGCGCGLMLLRGSCHRLLLMLCCRVCWLCGLRVSRGLHGFLLHRRCCWCILRGQERVLGIMVSCGTAKVVDVLVCTNACWARAGVHSACEAC